MKLKDGQKYRIKKIDKNNASGNAPFECMWDVNDILLFKNTPHTHFIKKPHDCWFIGNIIKSGLDYSELLEEVSESTKPINKFCEHCSEKAKKFEDFLKTLQSCYYDSSSTAVLNTVGKSFREIFEIGEEKK